jgi:NAD(P)-dependent dehydrogenase (short-subunit alcohol dehydrogenase family)
MRCDHTDEPQVELLFHQVSQHHGQLDILVNNVWGGYEDMANFAARFWDQPLGRWDAMITRGARAHFVASKHAVPLMQKGDGGLVVGTTYFSEGEKIGNVLYDVAKAAINRLAWAMAQELREYRIASVALSPGFVRTEKVLEQFSVTEENWATVKRLAKTESPEYIGRAVVALAADPAVMNKTGAVLYAGALAQEYGFTDRDGRQPPPYQH